MPGATKAFTDALYATERDRCERSSNTGAVDVSIELAIGPYPRRDALHAQEHDAPFGDLVP